MRNALGLLVAAVVSMAGPGCGPSLGRAPTVSDPTRVVPVSALPDAEGLTPVQSTLSAIDPRLEEARTDPDSARRLATLDAVASDPKSSRAAIREAHVLQSREFAAKRSIAAMENAAREVEISDDLPGAYLLEAMARAHALAKQGGDLERALRQARRAQEVLEGMRRPKKMESDLWDRRMSVQRALFQETLGLVLLAGGDAKGAAREFKAAAHTLPDRGSVNFHLGRALAQLKDGKGAQEAFARAVVAECEESEQADAAGKALALEAGLQEYEWKAKVAAARGSLAARYRERVLQDRLDGAAEVHLMATDASGKAVGLEKLLEGHPLAGRPTVLVFWASYDARSLHALRAAVRLAQDGACRLVAVSTDRTVANARLGAAEIGVPFVWGHDASGEDAKALQVRAVPTVLVLDAKGSVRYRNEGVVPGYQAFLKARLDSLQDTQEAHP